MFNVYFNGVVREANVRVLEKGLELKRANRGRFEVDQLLFADDTYIIIHTFSVCIIYNTSG